MNDFTANEQTSEITIDDGSFFYSIDMDKKTGIRTKSTNASTLAAVKEMTQKQRQNYVAGMLKMGESATVNGGGGSEFIEMAQYLGKNCRVFDAFGTKSWLWENIVLKSTSDEFEMTAEEINTDVPVPEDKFTVPEGIRIIDVTESGEE